MRTFHVIFSFPASPMLRSMTHIVFATTSQRPRRRNMPSAPSVRRRPADTGPGRRALSVYSTKDGERPLGSLSLIGCLSGLRGPAPHSKSIYLAPSIPTFWSQADGADALEFPPTESYTLVSEPLGTGICVEARRFDASRLQGLPEPAAKEKTAINGLGHRGILDARKAAPRP